MYEGYGYTRITIKNMIAKKLLQQKGIDSNKPILRIDRLEAVGSLLEFIKKWKLSIKIENLHKKDWEKLFSSYADAIIDYHPENDHQERGTFLRNEQMLKKYGLTDEDVKRLDFC